MAPAELHPDSRPDSSVRLFFTPDNQRFPLWVGGKLAHLFYSGQLNIILRRDARACAFSTAVISSPLKLIHQVSTRASERPQRDHDVQQPPEFATFFLRVPFGVLRKCMRVTAFEKVVATLLIRFSGFLRNKKQFRFSIHPALDRYRRAVKYIEILQNYNFHTAGQRSCEVLLRISALITGKLTSHLLLSSTRSSFNLATEVATQ